MNHVLFTITVTPWHLLWLGVGSTLGCLVAAGLGRMQRQWKRRV